MKEPFIDSPVTGGTVDAGTKILLSCETPGSRIYYTTDGSPPELHQESVKVRLSMFIDTCIPLKDFEGFGPLTFVFKNE